MDEWKRFLINDGIFINVCEKKKILGKIIIILLLLLLKYIFKTLSGLNLMMMIIIKEGDGREGREGEGEKVGGKKKFFFVLDIEKTNVKKTK